MLTKWCCCKHADMFTHNFQNSQALHEVVWIGASYVSQIWEKKLNWHLPDKRVQRNGYKMLCRKYEGHKQYWRPIGILEATIISTARVFRSDSQRQTAQWLAMSIRESWRVLWLVIRLLSVRADVWNSVIKTFFLVLHSPPHLSACWSSPHHYQYFYSSSEDCHV
jgi:hypothetical protein